MSVRDVIQAAAGAAGTTTTDKTYVEDVFSTYLYTGNGSTQTITNGIDLAGKGGMVWVKVRDNTWSHNLVDTARGNNKILFSNRTDAEYINNPAAFTSFNSNGFSLQDEATLAANASGYKYVSWTFRKQPKFFDVVTYTGTGVGGNTINHSLGQTPGMILVKDMSGVTNWSVWHKDLTAASYSLTLNLPDAQVSNTAVWNNTAPTDTTFTVGSSGKTNASGHQYIAYLFAHDTTTDGLIQCGSYTGNGSTSGPTVNLGWEPQYVMIKNASGTGNWVIFDNMRGLSVGASADPFVCANLPLAESTATYVDPTATGFNITSTNPQINTSGSTYIYMAIRRPMKVPTDGTKVFSTITHTGTSTTKAIDTGFTTDFIFTKQRNDSTGYWDFEDRLRGSGAYLSSNVTSAEATSPNTVNFQTSKGVILGNDSWVNNSNFTYVLNAFKRAPGFFDVVCYTGNGSTLTVDHGLSAIPELAIIKSRSIVDNWRVMTNVTSTGYSELNLNLTNAAIARLYGSDKMYSAKPTSTQVFLGTPLTYPGATYVAYLFASCPGVSKVGTVVMSGSSVNVDCGFTNGARFVMLKNTTGTSNWWVYDTARGIVAAADPYLALNSTAAETSSDDIDPYAPGFTMNTGLSNGTWLYLAIA